MDKLSTLKGLVQALPREDWPTGVLAKVVLASHILPGFSDAEKAAITRKRAGLDRKKKPSFLFLGNNMYHCTGTLDADDEKDAKKYMTETHCQVVSMQENALAVVLERKWITLDAYNDALPSAEGRAKTKKAEKPKVES